MENKFEPCIFVFSYEYYTFNTIQKLNYDDCVDYFNRVKDKKIVQYIPLKKLESLTNLGIEFDFSRFYIRIFPIKEGVK